MRRLSLIFLMSVLFIFDSEGRRYVIADSITHLPLPNASIFNRQGNTVGISRSDGQTPFIAESDYPFTIRYLGYSERTVSSSAGDTIFMTENIRELPEVVVESRKHTLLHLLAYVREYSTLTSYTDTVFLFREKMVDFMLPSYKKMKYKGWQMPRVLSSKSYYRYTNLQGLDSVSNRCSNHFSWADWVGVAPAAKIPQRLRRTVAATDTVSGRYSATEVWNRNDDRLTLDVDVMADTTSRKWVPNLSNFFRNNVDFERFSVRFNYDNIGGDSISPVNLTGYSFNIESNGRGHKMFMFNRRDEPFFVSTYAEAYILDKEYITVKEAKKWENRKTGIDDIPIYEPPEAPELQADIQLLVDRVNSLDHDHVRLALTPDKRLAGRHIARQHFGQRVLQLLKTATGISSIQHRRNLNRRWKEFREDIKKKKK